MDVVSAISTVPTYKPSSRIRQFNDLAEFFGDDRAANARSLWNKPLKAVVIKSCGLVNAANTARLPWFGESFGFFPLLCWRHSSSYFWLGLKKPKEATVSEIAACGKYCLQTEDKLVSVALQTLRQWVCWQDPKWIWKSSASFITPFSGPV